MSDYLIGVQARVEDARLLLEAGRYEGALLMLLVALSATSRKYYPESKMKSGEAFKKFVEDRKDDLAGIEDALKAAGIPASLGDFLWATLRCAFEHEGQLSAAHHPAAADVLVTLSSDGSKVTGLTQQMLASLEKAISRCWASSWQATHDEMRHRHPAQQDEPTVESRTIHDPSEPLRERLERISFFLRWFRFDRRAIEALEMEKAELEKCIGRGLSE